MSTYNYIVLKELFRSSLKDSGEPYVRFEDYPLCCRIMVSVQLFYGCIFLSKGIGFIYTKNMLVQAIHVAGAV